MTHDKIALSLVAHPDDAEFLHAGTLALLKDRGWRIHLATLTPGDCGSKEFGPEELSAIRRKEAAKAARLLDAEYTCLESRDIFIMYDEPTLRKVIHIIRAVRPAIVLSHSPQDYMIDHTTVSQLAMTGCFSAGMPNIIMEDVDILDFVPRLYYSDPIEGIDIFGNDIKPRIVVNISGKIGLKREMLCCHASQRDWLLKHHGVDEYVHAM